jgi:hypothetical protein
MLIGGILLGWYNFGILCSFLFFLCCGLLEHAVDFAFEAFYAALFPVVDVFGLETLFTI